MRAYISELCTRSRRRTGVGYCLPEGCHKRGLKEGKTELTEKPVQETMRFHELMDGLLCHPVDTVEHIRKQ